LQGVFTSEFVVRDGKFGSPIQILEQANNWAFSANDRGDVLVAAVIDGDVYALNFDAGVGTWSRPTLIENTAAPMLVVSGALDHQGNAIVVFSDFAIGGGGGWNRYIPGTGWGDSRTDAIAGQKRVALANNGLAVLVHSVPGEIVNAYTLARGATQWSGPEGFVAAGSGWLTMPLGNSVLATYADNRSRTYLGKIYSPGTGWSAPEAIGTPGGDANSLSGDSRGDTALLTWTETSGVRARLYDRGEWGPTVLLGSAWGGNSSATAGEHALVTWAEAGPSQDSSEIRVRRYSKSSGWNEPTSLGLATQFGSNTVMMSGSGAALAAWTDGDAVTYRRQLPEANWDVSRRIKGSGAGDVLDVWAADTLSGEAIMIWRVEDNGFWSARFE